MAIATGFYTLFYKQHFHKQCQAEIGKKLSKMLSNTLGLNFWQTCPKNKLFYAIVW